MNIIGQRKIFFTISAVLFLASIVALAILGLRLGIDFTGGSILEVEYSGVRPDAAVLRTRADGAGLGELLFSPTGEKGLFVRTVHISEEDHQKLLVLLKGNNDE